LAAYASSKILSYKAFWMAQPWPLLRFIFALSCDN